MKKLNAIITMIFLACTVSLSYSQVMNFETLKREDRHIATLHAGLEYGLTFGAGYAYHLKSRLPILLQAEYSLPAGKKLLDDFKVKIGAEVCALQLKNFRIAGRVQGVFRRTQNDFVRLLNFGSDMSVTAGYYKRKWFAAGEIGFDKAIVTHFKHFSSYKDVYPMVQDGWFDPSTGGNFYYGLRAGCSIKRNDIYIKAGRTLTQNFSEDLLPFYAELGYTIKFNKGAGK